MFVWCRLTDTGHYGRLRAEPALKLAQLVSCFSACLVVGIVFTVHDVIARSRNIVLYMVEPFLNPLHDLPALLCGCFQGLDDMTEKSLQKLASDSYFSLKPLREERECNLGLQIRSFI